MFLKPIALAAATLASVLAAPLTAQTVNLKMATFATSDSPWGQAMRAFAETAKEKSDGRINVSPYTDGQLGGMQQILAGMQLGTIEMAYFDVAMMAFLKGAEVMDVATVPYIFNSRADASKVLNSELFQGIYDDLAGKTGVRVFAAYGDRSARAIQTTKGPITKPEDMVGLRMRVPGLALYEETFRTLGAQLTALDVTEIYNGLSRGIVDGQDNGYELAVPPKFHEVAKHWSETDHLYGVTGWFISESVWKRLSEEDRAVLLETAKIAGDVSTQATLALDTDGRRQLDEAGVTYTVPDRDAFKAALKDVHLKYEGTRWPEGLVAQIRSMQE